MTIRKLSILVIICVLASFAVAACQEKAPPAEVIQIDGFEVTLSQPQVEFPHTIAFEVAAASAEEISRITLEYRVEKTNVFPVTSVTFPLFQPGTRVSTRWTWDMRQTGGLPPGTDLSYWWTFEDAGGHAAQTPERSISFDDERHSWRSLSGSGLNLFWYQGTGSFAEQLMAAAEEALDRLADDTGAGLRDGADIYIYADGDDLRGAMVYPQEWTGGVAYTEYRTIAIGISPDNLAWGKRAMAHELAHLAVQQATFSGYGVDLPTWLEEGIAMNTEGELTAQFQAILDSAIAKNELFTVKSLCSPFPADPDSTYIAYSQSHSIVEYLISERGGRAKMLQLLNAFKAGSGYVEALDQVYGLDIVELNALWRDYVNA
ncbi:MAG: peptidase MA domain-containing protein [Chloroflexi bacterium]|nr:peptidase MA domain-containing protein [Chloroflexota bacterium]